MLKIDYSSNQTSLSGNQFKTGLLKSFLDVSDEAFFILNTADSSIIDCNESALKLFEASATKQLINLPSFRLYNYEPLELSRNTLIDEIRHKGEYSQEMSFRTLKQNVFWGKMTQKNVSDEHGNFTLLKITKAADYLKAEEALSMLLNGTSKVTGKQFFRELTRLLGQTFNASNAFVASVDKNQPEFLDVVYLWGEEELDIKSIQIKNSCVENVLRGYTSYYPQGMKELFPNDVFIDELQGDSFIGAPIFDSTGISIGLIGVVHTKPMDEIPNSRHLLSIFASRSAAEIQRIKSKEILREQTRSLAEANAMKDRLLSVIAHDLQAPLHTVLGFGEMIKSKIDQYSKAEIASKIEIMDQSIRNLYFLLENIADWSRIQRNKVRFDPRQIVLKEIIDINLDLLGYLAGMKGVEINNNITSEFNVLSDHRMINTIVRNLLSNAIKFTHNGGKVILNASKQDDVVVVSISETKTSYKKEEISCYFDEIEDQLYHNQNKEDHPSLGLYLCKEFIDRQGGKLWYEPYKDQGITFYFELPSVD